MMPMTNTGPSRVALIEAGSPGLHIYSHVAMGRGVAILATILHASGYDVRAFIEDVSGKGSVDWDYVAGADVVGFSSVTCTLPRTGDLIRHVREVNPRAFVLLGGPEPTCAPRRAFEVGADFVLRGEGDVTLPAFLEALQRGRAERAPDRYIRAIPGAAWFEDGQVRYGPPPRQLSKTELSALPMVDNSLVHESSKRTTGLVWRSRGCPERCGFCEVREIWPKYALRDEDISIEELMKCQDEHCGGVFLIDDNAAANKASFKRFLRGAIERGFARPMAVQIRADAAFDMDGRLDRELLKLLKRAATTTMVCIGVESADDEGLAKLGKRTDSRRMGRALRAMQRYGLLVHGMFIALADDTVETLKRNGAYARKYVTSLQYLFETPLPGTERTREHETAGRILWSELADLAFFDGMHISIRPERMLPKEMQDRVLAEYLKFYSRMRMTAAFIDGLFFRFRLLTPAQRAYLRGLGPLKRLKEWMWLHIQFKFAPWALLRIGRRRVMDFLQDASYAEYRARLEG